MQCLVCCWFVLLFIYKAVNLSLSLIVNMKGCFIMQKNPEVSCPYCKKKNGIKKYGFTRKNVQRYKCICGKSFILPVVEEKRPNCPICKNNMNVIKWGKINEKYDNPRYKKQRYFCTTDKKHFSRTIKIYDEEKIIKTYLALGDDGLKEFCFDGSVFNVKTFTACREIINEYNKMTEERYMINGDLESIYME